MEAQPERMDWEAGDWPVKFLAEACDGLLPSGGGHAACPSWDSGPACWGPAPEAPPFPWHQQRGELQLWAPSEASPYGPGGQDPVPNGLLQPGNGPAFTCPPQQQQQQQRSFPWPSQAARHCNTHSTIAATDCAPASLFPLEIDIITPARWSNTSADGRTPRSSATDFSFTADLRRTSFASDTGSRRGSSSATPRGSLCGAEGRRLSSLTGDGSRRGSSNDEAPFMSGVCLGADLFEPAARLKALQAVKLADRQRANGAERSLSAPLDQGAPEPSGSVPVERSQPPPPNEEPSTRADSGHTSTGPPNSGRSEGASAGRRPRKPAQEQLVRIKALEDELEGLNSTRAGIEERLRAAREEMERLQGREMELLAIQRIFDSEKKALAAELAARGVDA